MSAASSEGLKPLGESKDADRVASDCWGGNTGASRGGRSSSQLGVSTLLESVIESAAFGLVPEAWGRGGVVALGLLCCPREVSSEDLGDEPALCWLVACVLDGDEGDDGDEGEFLGDVSKSNQSSCCVSALATPGTFITAPQLGHLIRLPA